MYPQGYSSNNASGLDMRAERNTPRHQRSISTPESDLISEAPMYHVEPSENNANRNGRRCSGSTSDMFSQPQQQQQTSPFKNLQNRRVSGGGLTTIGHQQTSDKNGHYQPTNYFPSTNLHYVADIVANLLDEDHSAKVEPGTSQEQMRNNMSSKKTGYMLGGGVNARDE